MHQTVSRVTLCASQQALAQLPPAAATGGAATAAGPRSPQQGVKAQRRPDRVLPNQPVTRHLRDRKGRGGRSWNARAPGMPECPGAPGMPGVPSGMNPEGAGSDEWPDWVIWLAVTVGLSVVAVIGFVIVDQSKKGPKKKLTVNDDQIGSYRKVCLMQTGATSQVWEVSEFGSGRHFAIKMLLPEVAHDPDERALLFHEAEVGQKLAHPNIIKVVSIVRDKDHPHVVMDFFPCGNLKLRIQRKEVHFLKQMSNGNLKQTPTALAFMNMKVWVHSNAKPENILVDANGKIRIIDFAIAQPIKKGMAKSFIAARKPKARIATSRPNKIRNEPLDGTRDIYSFAAAAYEIVTGRPPFLANRQDLLENT